VGPAKMEDKNVLSAIDSRESESVCDFSHLRSGRLSSWCFLYCRLSAPGAFQLPGFLFPAPERASPTSRNQPREAPTSHRAQTHMEVFMAKPREPNEPELITLAAACRRAGITTPTAIRLMPDQFPAATWLGGKRVLGRERFERWLRAKADAGVHTAA
jgi:hypothetical protein